MAATKFSFFVISTLERGDFQRIIVIDLFQIDLLLFLDIILNISLNEASFFSLLIRPVQRPDLVFIASNSGFLWQ